MNPTTMKFIKKANVPVILCKSYGMYLTRPRYSKEYRKGKVKYEFEVLFTKEQISQLSEEEMYRISYKKPTFSDYGFGFFLYSFF